MIANTNITYHQRKKVEREKVEEEKKDFSKYDEYEQDGDGRSLLLVIYVCCCANHWFFRNALRASTGWLTLMISHIVILAALVITLIGHILTRRRLKMEGKKKGNQTERRNGTEKWRWQWKNETETWKKKCKWKKTEKNNDGRKWTLNETGNGK